MRLIVVTAILTYASLTIPTSAHGAHKNAKLDANKAAQTTKLANQVFERLLAHHSTTTHTPKLIVNESPSIPSANALANGNIAISVGAIDFCLTTGARSGTNLLAFVLAHELAHIDGDDHKLPMLAESSNDVPLPAFLVSTRQGKNNITKEQSADKKALVMMELSGFSSNDILNRPNFFSAWIEETTDISCTSPANALHATHCTNALARHQSLVRYRDYVAQQTNLYFAGLRRLIVGDYELSREFLYEFVKEIPSAFGYAQIGLTYIFEAMDLVETHRSELGLSPYAYPIRISMVDVDDTRKNFDAGVLTLFRGTSNAESATARVHTLVDRAIANFDRAFEIKPFREFLVNKATALILDKRPITAKGVIAEQYERQFGKDVSSEMLLAIADHQENNNDGALKRLRLLQNITKEQHDTFLAKAVKWNQNVIQDRNTSSADFIKGNDANQSIGLQKTTFSAKGQFRAGQRLQISGDQKLTPLWLNGRRYFLFNDQSEASILTDNNRVIIEIKTRLPSQPNFPEDIVNSYGIPDRFTRTLDTAFFVYQQRRAVIVAADDGETSIIHY